MRNKTNDVQLPDRFVVINKEDGQLAEAHYNGSSIQVWCDRRDIRYYDFKLFMDECEIVPPTLMA